MQIKESKWHQDSENKEYFYPFFLFYLLLNNLPACITKIKSGKITYSGAESMNTSLFDIILEDKSYGKMQPRNGKDFTFAIYDIYGVEVTNRQVLLAVTLAWEQWEIETPIKVRKAKSNENPDFRVYFKNPTTDKTLTKSTIMYNYFPINDLNHKYRGLCVVNTDFYYSVHGQGIPMHIIDPIHYTPDDKAKGSSIDLDQVFSHEFGHALGLPHSKQPNNVMSGNYGVMAEYLSLEDIARIRAKYGERKYVSNLYDRIKAWFKIRSDKY